MLSEKAKKEMLTGGVVCVIGVILFLARKQVIPAQSAAVPVTIQGVTQSPIPDYLSYNMPKTPSYSGLSLPNSSLAAQTFVAGQVPATNSTGSCLNCSDLDDSSGLAYSLNNAIASLVNGVQNFNAQYLSSMQSALPAQTEQYINNPTGSQLSSQLASQEQTI